jgi:hypothetical protein
MLVPTTSQALEALMLPDSVPLAAGVLKLTLPLLVVLVPFLMLTGICALRETPAES